MSPDSTPSGADRRKAPRYPASRLPSLRASILAGPDVSVINVSRGGLLLESDVRLRPGSGLCLSLTLDGTIHVLNGRITRVDARIGDSKIVYVAGVVLDEETEIFDLPEARTSRAGPDERVPAEPLPSSPVREPTAHDEEIRVLREELRTEREGRERQAAVLESMQQALQDGERLRCALTEAHAAERVRWEDEQRQLDERVREAEEQAASMVQDMRAARDAARRLTQEHRQRVAALETDVREKQQQLTELQAAQAALLESLTLRLQAHERKHAVVKAHEDRMSVQLANTEGWCADQQDLLYRIRQQMSTVFALLQGVDPPIDRSGGAPLRSLPSPGLDLPPALMPIHTSTRDTDSWRGGWDSTHDGGPVRKTGT